jgi:hypothetical protein
VADKISVFLVEIEITGETSLKLFFTPALMATPDSSRSSSPVQSFYDRVAPLDHDYIESLAKHCGDDALRQSFSASPPTSPKASSFRKQVTEESKSTFDRTFSNMEKAHPTPKRRPSIVSALMSYRSRRSDHRKHKPSMTPSELQSSNFYVPITKILKALGPVGEDTVNQPPSSAIVKHVEGQLLFFPESRS